MLGLLASAAVAHVPTYDSGNQQCLTPPRTHTTSQVAYILAEPGTTSGLEVHCSLEDCPFAYDTNELIDFDATFKEAYDTSTYKLYVGCTGCMPEPEDPITIAPLAVAYSPAKVEPFTQHSYRSLAGVDKKFSSSKIDPAVCPNGHWGIRLVTFPNASTMYWGAVVGLGESFTAQELLEFPLYLQKNHAEWNGAGWTLPLIAVLVPLIDLLVATVAWCVSDAERRWLPTIINDPRSARSWACQLAIWAWLVAGTEVVVHLLIAQADASFGQEFWIGLLVVGFAANGIPFLITRSIWIAHLYDRGCWSSPWWSLAQVSLFTGWLFVLAGGLFVGPACMILDGLVRLTELVPEEAPIARPEDELSLSGVALPDL